MINQLARSGKSPKRLLTRITVVIALAATGVVVAAVPAAAHQEVSQTRVSIGAAARTIYGPTIAYDLSDLGTGCSSSFRATWAPTWRVSNVTSSSVYIDYMSYTFSPGRSADLGFTALLNGSGNSVWTGNWRHLNITSLVKKTYYFRKTVSFSGSGYVDLYQWFHFDPGSSPGNCSDDKAVHFWLRRS
jgi:hypothetical protein